MWEVSRVNKMSICGLQLNPNFKFHVPFHSTKITVWCGIKVSKINRTHFFEDMETGTAFTITKERYIDKLEQFF